MQGFFTKCFVENHEQNTYFTQKPQVEINYFFIKNSIKCDKRDSILKSAVYYSAYCKLDLNIIIQN